MVNKIATIKHIVWRGRKVRCTKAPAMVQRRPNHKGTIVCNLTLHFCRKLFTSAMYLRAIEQWQNVPWHVLLLIQKTSNVLKAQSNLKLPHLIPRIFTINVQSSLSSHHQFAFLKLRRVEIGTSSSYKGCIHTYNAIILHLPFASTMQWSCLFLPVSFLL